MHQLRGIDHAFSAITNCNSDSGRTDAHAYPNTHSDAYPDSYANANSYPKPIGVSLVVGQQLLNGNARSAAYVGLQ
jgi:hypothetical protein